MTSDEIRLYMQMANMIITGAVGVYVWIGNRHKVTDERIFALEEAVDRQLNDASRRITRLEAHAEAAPKHEDIRRVEKELSLMSTSMGRVEGEMQALNQNVRLLLQRVTDGK